MQYNLGSTMWRCRERSLNCCCAFYYQSYFQNLCKNLLCQVGTGEVALGMLRCPSPQLVCRVQRNSSGVRLDFGLVEQTWAALEDAVGKILQVECHSGAIALKHSQMSCPAERTLVAP